MHHPFLVCILFGMPSLHLFTFLMFFIFLYIEDCEGWWLSGCRGSVAEHWRLKPVVSWVRLPAAAGLFHFPLFAPHFIYFQLEARYSQHILHVYKSCINYAIILVLCRQVSKGVVSIICLAIIYTSESKRLKEMPGRHNVMNIS